MNIREQLDVLVSEGVEFLVVGGQAGVLRQAIEFSHDLDVLIAATPENAARVRKAVGRIAGVTPDLDTILGRDFQQYIHDESGSEIDVHLKLIAIPGYAAGQRNASDVDYLGLVVPVLELPALYASKRTDRPRDAVHRMAIEDRLSRLVLSDAIEVDDVVLSCCLDAEVARHAAVAQLLPHLAETSRQPLLQTRLAAIQLHVDALFANPALHATPRALLALEPSAREKLVEQPARLAALLARVPLELPPEGYRLKWRRS